MTKEKTLSDERIMITDWWEKRIHHNVVNKVSVVKWEDIKEFIQKILEDVDYKNVGDLSNLDFVRIIKNRAGEELVK